MEERLSNILEKVLKVATVLLTIALVWFSMVFYPGVVNRFKGQSGNRGGLVGNVEASSKGLPFGNSHFRIQYLDKSNVYLVVVSATTTEQYTQYRNEAQLTLKNILSLDSLCGLNIVYRSNSPFGVTQKSSKNSC